METEIINENNTLTEFKLSHDEYYLVQERMQRHLGKQCGKSNEEIMQMIETEKLNEKRKKEITDLLRNNPDSFSLSEKKFYSSKLFNSRSYP